MLIVITQSSPTLGGATELTRTPRRHRWVRTGYAYEPPALGTYRRRRAACPQGPTYCTYGVRAYQPRAFGTHRVPWHPTGGHRVGRCVFAARFDRTRIYAGCDNGEVRVFDYSSRPESAHAAGEGGFTPRQKQALQAAFFERPQSFGAHADAL